MDMKKIDIAGQCWELILQSCGMPSKIEIQQNMLKSVGICKSLNDYFRQVGKGSIYCLLDEV